MANTEYKEITNIVSIIYPVGSIYISTNSANPATLFAGTTWTRIQKKFLLAAGDDEFTAGDEGGATTVSYTPQGSCDAHTLTTSEIPSHTHGLNGHSHSYNDYYGYATSGTAISVAQMPSHTHRLGVASVAGGGGGGTVLGGNDSLYTGGTGSGNSHSHDVYNTAGTFTSQGNSDNTTSSGSGGSHSHSFTGTAATFSILPPYLSVYMWERIS